MAALDFPNSPTTNQQYVAPNGVTYQYDGAAWVTLVGPPPTIPSGAVRGTPSSGGTQREILKASIWGGDDLIDLSVPVAKLALGASLRQAPIGKAIPTSTTISAIGAWTDVTTQAITTTGGRVLLLATLGAWASGTAGTLYQVLLGFGRDSVTATHGQVEQRFQMPGSGTSTVPLATLFAIDTGVTAGAHTYHLVVYNVTTGVSVTTAAAWPGTLYLLELA